MSTRLELKNLAKSFDKEVVLHDVNLTVAPGETIAIYGPSGGGKTVLLNLISGALPLDHGDIILDGKSVAVTPPEGRDVSMAFQNFALYPHMSAFDNIASPLRSRGVTEVKEKVTEIAELLKIDRFLSHLPAALSNGQKQRTSLARALVAAPAVLLLDDPLRNVDAKLRYEMRLEMPELFRRINSAVIYVTQDCREAMALADRIAILRDGGIAQIGKPEEVYAEPADAEIGRLLGEPTMNVFDCTATVAEAKVTVAPAQVKLELTQYPELHSGTDCLVGVRPEDVIVGSNGSGVAARVEAVTPTNLRSLVVMRTEADEEIVAACDEGIADGLATGTQVSVNFSADKVLLFAKDSGQRIAPVT